MGAFLMNNPKCVFIHIPKTAGTTIRKGVFNEDYEGPVFEEIPKEWEKYFKFAFVRNPYDRMVSAWKMFTSGMQKTQWVYNDKLPLENISFLDFLKLATDDSIEYSSRKDIYSVLRHHTLPQTHHYHCFQYADFIGRFENLSADFKIIAEKIDLKDYSISHLNKTNRASYKEYYNDETYKLVTEYYDSDIKAFDYKF